MKIFLLFVIALLGVYLIDCAMARKILRPKFPDVLVWFFGVGMIGVLSELLLNTIIAAIFGHPLWEYRVLPIKNGYISLVGPILWGIFGVHLYLQNMALKKYFSRLKIWQKSLIMGVDAMIIETLMNLLSIAILGDFFFYYFPPDLAHYTSFVNLPLWTIGGFVIYHSIKRFQCSPYFTICFSIVIEIGLLI